MTGPKNPLRFSVLIIGALIFSLLFAGGSPAQTRVLLIDTTVRVNGANAPAGVTGYNVLVGCDGFGKSSVFTTTGGGPARSEFAGSDTTRCTFNVSALPFGPILDSLSTLVVVTVDGIRQPPGQLGISGPTVPVPQSANVDISVSYVDPPTPTPIQVSFEATTPSFAVTGYEFVLTCGSSRETVRFTTGQQGQVATINPLMNAAFNRCSYQVEALNGLNITNPSTGQAAIEVNGQVVAIQALSPVAFFGESSLPLPLRAPRSVKFRISYPVADEYSAVPATRLLDSRDGTGGVLRKLRAGETVELPLPSGKASVLNVTVTEPEGPGWVTAFPCGGTRPLTSNLNFSAGQTVANLVLALPTRVLGAGIRTCFYTSQATHLIVDGSGTFPANSTFGPFFPHRVVDTRLGAGAPKRKLLAGEVLQLPLYQSYGATVINVTATNPSGPGWINIFRCDLDRPLSSNLNFATGETVANLVLAPTGRTGAACLYSSQDTDVVVDELGGLFLYQAVNPIRALDTRNNTGGIGHKLMAGETVRLMLPPGKATAVNVTATGSHGPGWIAVYPCDDPRPMVSNLNFDTNQTVANLVFAQPGPSGETCIYTSADTHLIADIQGTFPRAIFSP